MSWADTVIVSQVLTCVPLCGVVMATNGAELSTLTVRDADFVLPAASYALTVRVCAPLVCPAVLQEKEYG